MHNQGKMSLAVAVTIMNPPDDLQKSYQEVMKQNVSMMTKGTQIRKNTF